jgi:HAD superfamily hydrolase (TIGR01509 family)
MMGKSYVRSCEVLQSHFGAELDVEKLFEIHYKIKDDFIIENGVPVKKGLYLLLDKLEQLNIKKSVATSTGKSHAIKRLADANIAHRFEAIICGDDVINGKPSPDIFLKATASCGICTENCIVIEDTEAGVRGAIAAGIRVVAVPDIAPLNEKIRAKADFICKDLFEAAEMF